MVDLKDASIIPFLYVQDWERAEWFYREALGLRWEPKTADWVMVKGGSGSALTLISEAQRYETSPVHRAGVFFLIDTDLAALLETLTAKGVAIARPLQQFSHGAEAAISDPDGNVLVLYTTHLPVAG